MVTLTQVSAPSGPAAPEASYKKMYEDVISREKIIKEKWLDKTKDVYDIYEGGKADETPFNILYSNTEVLVPNLFSNAPRPIVRKRFGEMRADGASRAAERMAEYCVDTNLSGYPDFVDAVEAAVMDAALPGQGQCRVRMVEGCACLDYVQHDKFIWAFAQRWEDTPWIAFRHDKTKKDIVREFKVPGEIEAQLTATSESTNPTKDKGPETIPVYEIWNKLDRKVYFLCEIFPQQFIQELDDPLKLEGFYPTGKPLRLLSTPISTMPRALYGLYRRQAEELNAITLRIKRVTQAIQIRGVVDAGLPELTNLLDTTDSENSLIPATNPGAMARESGLDRHIWILPVEKFIQVLAQLIQAREQLKSTIYEILGIGDILRGMSKASETLGAQQIKDKWGSLRIKKSREKVNTFVRTHIRLLIELSAKHVEEDSWAKITGLPFMPSMQANLLAQQAGPVDPASPPPPESWGIILGQLQSDLTRSYVIDIETNSTVDADATEDKQEVAEFMNALGQAMQGLESLAQAGPAGFEASKKLLVEICKRYRMGSEIQGIIEKMTPPPKGPTPEQQQQDEELKKREEAVQANEDQVKQAGVGLQTQQLQNQEQLNQLSQGLKDQQANIQKSLDELDQEHEKLKLAQKSLDLEKQALELQVQQWDLEHANNAAKADTTFAQKDLALQKKDMEITTKAKEVTSAAETSAITATVFDRIIEALKVQSETMTKLVEQLAKPVKITKTGPGTYERS